MNDTEAEAALLVLGNPLVWKDGPFTFVPDIRATFRDGRYTIHREKRHVDSGITDESEAEQECVCEYLSASTRRGKKPVWWHQPIDLAVAKRACTWHAAMGDWPRAGDKGWEFLSR